MEQVNRIPWLKKRYEIKDSTIRKELETDLVRVNEQLNKGMANFKLHLMKTAAELLLGLPEQAVESAKNALIIKTHSFIAWYLLGNGYLDTGHVHSAKTAYDIALKLYPHYSNNMLDEMWIVRDIYDSLQLIAVVEKNGEA